MLVGLVAVAGLVGALVGVAGHPSAASAEPRLSAIVATLRAAGTARFTYSSVTSSPNPLLRSISVGRGAVDFRTDSMTTVERDKETQISQGDTGPSRPTTQTLVNDQIFIGRSFYTQFGIVSSHFPDRWTKGTFPKASFGLLGVFDEVDPVGDLEGDLTTHGTKVELLGPERLGGAAVNRYRVVVPACAATPHTTGPRDVVGPIDLWLDGEGRLVQIRDAMHVTNPAGAFRGSSTITSTIRLSDFGAPVTVSAPKVIPEGEGAVAILLSVNGCPQ
jgi:hypothetical protein